MSSEERRISRRIRDYGHGEVTTNVPPAIVDELQLDSGDEVAIDTPEDGPGDIVLVSDLENAHPYAPRRQLRWKDGEFILNLPTAIRGDHDLDDGHELAYGTPQDGEVPATIQTEGE